MSLTGDTLTTGWAGGIVRSCRIVHTLRCGQRAGAGQAVAPHRVSFPTSNCERGGPRGETLGARAPRSHLEIPGWSGNGAASPDPARVGAAHPCRIVSAPHPATLPPGWTRGTLPLPRRSIRRGLAYAPERGQRGPGVPGAGDGQDGQWSSSSGPLVAFAWGLSSWRRRPTAWLSCRTSWGSTCRMGLR